jgi:hypothetical protein
MRSIFLISKLEREKYKKTYYLFPFAAILSFDSFGGDAFRNL